MSLSLFPLSSLFSYLRKQDKVSLERKTEQEKPQLNIIRNVYYMLFIDSSYNVPDCCFVILDSDTDTDPNLHDAHMNSSNRF